MHIAARGGHKALVELLLKLDTDATIENKWNDKAYYCTKDKEIKDILEEHSDITHRDFVTHA